TGLGVLLVEHDMRFVMGTCSYIHVLDFGRIIAGGPPDAIQANAAVRSAYLGAGPEEAAQQAQALDADALADVEALAEVVTAETESPVAVHEAPTVEAPGGEPAVAPALELRQVFAGYGTIDVLYGVDLVLEKGQVHALLGPNGAGKSTTLKVASGQIRPNTGDVLVDGESIGKARPDALARRGVCLIPEGRGVFPNLT